ncbi:MAG: thioredoxin family protein [Planctomycetota bacterium]
MRLLKHPVIFLSIATATFLGVLSCSSGSSSMTPPPAYFDPAVRLDAAMAQADREDKVVLAVASGDPWCAPCQRYKKAALSDPRVEEWVRANAIPVYISLAPGENDPEAARLGVRGVPTTVILRDGQIVDRHAGVIPAEQLLEMLATAGS